MFDLFRLATTGADVPLPDPSSILPYLGLFTLAILDPDNVYGCHISTQHVPPLSILRNKHFEDAPEGTSPVDDNVARIFDVLAFVAPAPPCRMVLSRYLPATIYSSKSVTEGCQSVSKAFLLH